MRRREFVRKSIAIPVIATTSSLLLSGCRTTPKPPVIKPKAYRVEIVADRQRAIEVDCFGVTLGKKAQWAAQDPVEYFAPGGSNRESSAHALEFPGTESEVPYSKMNSWVARGCTHLVVFAQIAAYEGPTGNRDARRLIVCLDYRKWLGDKVQIAVTKKGLSVLTEERPEGYKYE